MKQRSDLKKDRISIKGQIFLDGEHVGIIKKVKKIKYAKLMYGCSKEELIKISNLM